MISNSTTLAAALAAALAAGGWPAAGIAAAHGDGSRAAGQQQPTHEDGGHGHAHGDVHDDAGHAVPADAAPSTRAFVAANEAMHAGMEIDFTGDADVDFARGMIPHHQGAIDMARIVIEHGEDPAIRALAEEVIAAQAAEIAFLEAWLAEHAD